MANTCTTIKLTKQVVAKAEPVTLPDGSIRQRLYLDSELRGFGLLVGATTKSFVAIRTIRGGRRARITLGHSGEYATIDQARKAAEKALGEMADGRDPIAEKRKSRAKGVTLRDALQLMEQNLKAQERSERTIHGYRFAIETYLKNWLDRPLAEITKLDVDHQHKKIADGVAAGNYAGKYANGKKRKRVAGQGKATANAAIVAFRAAYNQAADLHELPKAPIPKKFWFKKKRHEAAPLTDLHIWHNGVMGLENTVRRDCLLFALHTGLRRTSVAEARWEDVDFEKHLLRVPRPKGGADRAFDLPLTGYLVDLLEARQKENADLFEKSPWVFPAISESGHIAEPNERIEGITWTMHDCRRWFSTVAESLDISYHAIKLLINHAMPKSDTTAGYIQRDVERLRKPMEAIGERLRILCLPPEAKVIQMRPAANNRVITNVGS